ncbi:MAG: hypothetical protein HQ578_08340 [Chloroflexi bacterium]|nr:hypothetical protein [Chloroflexota bacterium]
MQERVDEMASALMPKLNSLIRSAELTEPKAFRSLNVPTPETALVREKYALTCTEIERQLQKVLKQVQEKAVAPELEAKLTQAIERLQEIKKPYVSQQAGGKGRRGFETNLSRPGIRCFTK